MPPNLRLKRILEKKGAGPAYAQLLHKCARVLSLAQIKKLPDLLRDKVFSAYEKAEEKKKLLV